MAEIRKFDPAVGNAIAQALRAAMGDPLRPVEPGVDTTRANTAPPADEVPEPTSWVTLRVDNAPPADQA